MALVTSTRTLQQIQSRAENYYRNYEIRCAQKFIPNVFIFDATILFQWEDSLGERVTG